MTEITLVNLAAPTITLVNLAEPTITLVNLAEPTITLVQTGFGLQGPPGGAAITLIAAINLGGNRVVTGAASYADNTDPATVGSAIGVTQGAATMGSPVNIVAIGELDGFFGLTVNSPVYLSANGTTTQTLPTSGYIQKIGVAISTTKILLNFNPPMVQL